ncbi:MAG: MFS transporter [Myxococcota bacterium]
MQALRHPFVRDFAIGRFVATCATQIIATTVGWQLFQRTGDSFSLGLVGLVEIIPVIFLIVPAGNAIDRHPRKQVAARAHALLAAAALGLAALTALDGPTAGIYALLVLTGAARAYAAPSTGTIMPQLLSPHEFANANVWLSASYQLAAAVGPGLGGLLVAVSGGAFVPYLVSVVLIGVFLVLLTRIPTVVPPRQTTKRTSAELFAGFTFVRSQPVFLAAITLDLFAVLFGGATALLPAYAAKILHVGAAGYGWLRAAPALGALATALLLARQPPWRRPGVVMLWTVLGFGLASIAFGLSESFGLSFVMLLLVGGFDEVSVIIRHTLEQVITPDRLRGRVSAINHVFIGFSNELGAFESGSAAALIGEVPAVVAGGLLTLVVVGIVALRWPELRRIGPLHTLAPAAIPGLDEPSPATQERSA